jgi:peptidoglycan/xylan/chitin deacetylase (PgdA/CDA1 family)
MMRTEQVRTLVAAGMTVGGHTVTHPILSRLPDDEARAEIRAGRDALHDITGQPVRLFAYPNGKPDEDYCAPHVAMTRELGFAAALCTRWGAADASSDRYQLPRFTPWGSTFARFGVGLARNHLGLH